MVDSQNMKFILYSFYQGVCSYSDNIFLKYVLKVFLEY